MATNNKNGQPMSAFSSSTVSEEKLTELDAEEFSYEKFDFDRWAGAVKRQMINSLRKRNIR